jgi:radical SAM superfamily enzyme YgiQ (UPF0313 family)
LGLAYIASYLRKYSKTSHEIKIFTKNIIPSLTKYRPEVVGISSTTPRFNIAINLSREIKLKFGIPIFLGGQHISTLPYLTPPWVDAAVLGEGEQTVLELMDLWEGRGWGGDGLSKINGLAYYYEGKLNTTLSRDPLLPLDRVPSPARDLLETGGSVHILTSRGCPFKCRYCSATKFWGEHRFYSPEFVLEELKGIIKRYRFREINIFDDLFIADVERIERIARLIQNQGIHKKTNFCCHARTDLITAEVCGILKKMNVTTISFGFESGSEKILRFLKNGTATIEDNQKAVNLCKKFGFNILGSFMIGSPGETKEDIFKTIAFIKRNKIIANFYVATPFPNTEFWDLAGKNCSLDGSIDWSRLSPDLEDPREAVLLADKISKEDFLKTYNEFAREVEIIKNSSPIYGVNFSLYNLKRIIHNPRLFLGFTKRVLNSRTPPKISIAK